MNEFTDERLLELAGCLCVCALCLLSDLAVKDWNIHDLCVCVQVLKCDGFPSYMHRAEENGTI